MGSNNTRNRGVALELLFHQAMTVISLRDALQSMGGIRVVIPSQQHNITAFTHFTG